MQFGSSILGVVMGLLATPFVRGLAVPLASSLKSDITLLYNNDLNRESH